MTTLTPEEQAEVDLWKVSAFRSPTDCNGPDPDYVPPGETDKALPFTRKVKRGGDFLAEYTPIIYAIDGVLPSGAIYGLTAKHGGGKQQAGIVLNFIKGIFTEAPRFAALVDSITADSVVLSNRVTIQVRPASFRTIRGITAIAAIAEECSIWQPDDFGSTNPDREILGAVKPSLATTGGTLFCIGSPHAKRGETWRTFQKHFGPNGNPAILAASIRGCIHNQIRGRLDNRQ